MILIFLIQGKELTSIKQQTPLDATRQFANFVPSSQSTLHVRKPVGSNLSVSVWVWILGSFYPIPLHEGCMVPKVKVVELFVPCWFQLALGGKAFVVILCPVESKSRHIDQIVVLFDRS